MTSLLTISIEHERRCRGDIRRPAPPDSEMDRTAQRAAWFTTQALGEVTGPHALAVAMNDMCKTESERLGFVTAQYTELWRAYRRLATRAGEIEALVEANELEMSD